MFDTLIVSQGWGKCYSKFIEHSFHCLVDNVYYLRFQWLFFCRGWGHLISLDYSISVCVSSPKASTGQIISLYVIGTVRFRCLLPMTKGVPRSSWKRNCRTNYCCSRKRVVITQHVSHDNNSLQHTRTYYTTNAKKFVCVWGGGGIIYHIDQRLRSVSRHERPCHVA